MIRSASVGLALPGGCRRGGAARTRRCARGRVTACGTASSVTAGAGIVSRARPASSPRSGANARHQPVTHKTVGMRGPPPSPRNRVRSAGQPCAGDFEAMSDESGGRGGAGLCNYLRPADGFIPPRHRSDSPPAPVPSRALQRRFSGAPRRGIDRLAGVKYWDRRCVAGSDAKLRLPEMPARAELAQGSLPVSVVGTDGKGPDVHGEVALRNKPTAYRWRGVVCWRNYRCVSNKSSVFD